MRYAAPSRQRARRTQSVRSCGRWLRVPLLAAVLAVQLAAGTAQAATSSIEVERDGDRFTVAADAVLDADPRTAWETLTDYERLPQFVPGIRRTRVLSRGGSADGERLVVEYTGRFQLVGGSMPTHIWLEVRHLPMTEVQAQWIAPPPRAPGDPEPTLRAFTGRYTLTPLASPSGVPPRLRLGYTARFELAAPLPPVIGPMFGATAVRHALREQFEAMVGEIERRAARRPPADPPRTEGG